MRLAISEGRDVTVVVLNYDKNGKSFWNRVHIAHLNDQSGRTFLLLGIMTKVIFIFVFLCESEHFFLCFLFFVPFGVQLNIEAVNRNELHIIEDLPSILPLNVNDGNMVNPNLQDGKYSQFYHPYFSAYYDNTGGYSFPPPPPPPPHLVSLPAAHSMNSSATRVAAPFIPPFPPAYYPGPGPPMAAPLQAGVIPEFRQAGVQVAPPLGATPLAPLPVNYPGMYTPMTYPLQIQMPLNMSPSMTLPQVPAAGLHPAYAVADPFGRLHENPLLPIPAFLPGASGPGLLPYGYSAAPIFARPLVPGAVPPSSLVGVPGVVPFSAAMNPLYSVPGVYPDPAQLRLNATIYGQYPLVDAGLNPAVIPAPVAPYALPQPPSQLAPRLSPLSNLPHPAAYYQTSAAATVSPNTEPSYTSVSRQVNVNSSVNCDMNGNLLPYSSLPLSTNDQLSEKRSRSSVDPSLLTNMTSFTSTSNYNSSSSSQK
jgi:hypothetical protein